MRRLMVRNIRSSFSAMRSTKSTSEFWKRTMSTLTLLRQKIQGQHFKRGERKLLCDTGAQFYAWFAGVLFPRTACGEVSRCLGWQFENNLRIDANRLRLVAGIPQRENRLMRCPRGPAIHLERCWIAANPVRVFED